MTGMTRIECMCLHPHTIERTDHKGKGHTFTHSRRKSQPVSVHPLTSHSSINAPISAIQHYSECNKICKVIITASVSEVVLKEFIPAVSLQHRSREHSFKTLIASCFYWYGLTICTAHSAQHTH